MNTMIRAGALLCPTLTAVLAIAPACSVPGERIDPDAPQTSTELTPLAVQELAREAYVYGFPLVMNLKTLEAYTLDESSPEYKGPFNQVACEARLFTPEDRAVVTPNADTPYCMFWLDLRREPLVLSVPQMDRGRYYGIQLIDLFTHNFDYVGTRTNGGRSERVLVAGPSWSGEAPTGVRRVAQSETDLVLCIIRTQLFDDADLARVAEVQAGYGLEPLSAFLGEPAPRAVRPIDLPAWREGSEFTAASLETLDRALDLVDTPPQEAELRARLARIGLGTPDAFELDALTPERRAAIEAGVARGLEEIRAFVGQNSGDPIFSARIFGTREHLAEQAEALGASSPDLPRAGAALAGLYGNSGAEAVYPAYFVDADGEALDASKHDYAFRIARKDLPPTGAFWSLTMYDGATQLFVDNSIDRYLLNSRGLEGLAREENGDYVFHLRKDSPTGPELANWLPTPNGPFYVILRLYLPKPEVLDGSWQPPKLRKAAGSR